MLGRVKTIKITLANLLDCALHVVSSSVGSSTASIPSTGAGSLLRWKPGEEVGSGAFRGHNGWSAVHCPAGPLQRSPGRFVWDSYYNSVQRMAVEGPILT